MWRSNLLPRVTPFILSILFILSNALAQLPSKPVLGKGNRQDFDALHGQQPYYSSAARGSLRRCGDNSVVHPS